MLRSSSLFSRNFRRIGCSGARALCSAPAPPVAQKYPHLEYEKKWQAFWEVNKSFKAPVMPGPKKKYILDMFPYPSGSGLHVGHPCGYTATDIMSRYWRMQGYDVLHPMGWDAFGLPAEQHAMNTGTHPAVTTKTNINTFRSQLKALGFSYDWDREIATTHNTYVRWTQWIFLQLFKNGLAFQGNQNVNWCPALGTVLANEEVIDGLSERGNHPVIKHPIRQWVLKITAYGDQLHDHLEGLNWPEGTMAAQKAWIGRQEGANVRFRVPVGGAGTGAPDLHLDTFTSRVETLMGVTFIAVAPEHPLVNALLGAVRASLPDGDAAHEEHCAAVRAYVESVASKTDLERAIDVGKDRAKTGLLLHPELFAEHPLTGAKVPIFLADYVLSGYGSGAVMGVPGHDERDRSFAAMFDLPAVTITEDDKVLCNSGEFDGLSVENARRSIVAKLASAGAGESVTNYRLRDWGFSRQRYWGEPIPIYYPVEPAAGVDASLFDPRKDDEHIVCFEQPIAVDEAELPLLLPEMTDFQPVIASATDGETAPWSEPEGCLGRVKDWKYFSREVVAPSGELKTQWYARETNTMPQWAGSCWYYLRYIDPHNESALCDPVLARAWLPVDMYVGGQEHATLHLLYARFWHKVLYDLGVVPKADESQIAQAGRDVYSEPFQQLVHQGMILGPDGEKMSKSRGNVISPDDIVSEHGADVLRVYEMFMGPLNATKPWDNDKVVGISRFLNRIYTLVGNFIEAREGLGVTMDADAPAASPTSSDALMNTAIAKVTTDIEATAFNTAISALMIYSNGLQKNLRAGDAALLPSLRNLEVLTVLLSPFAPHVAEECYELLQQHRSQVEEGFEYSSAASGGLTRVPWPVVESPAAEGHVNTVKISVRVNGKFKCDIDADVDSLGNADEAAAALLVLALEEHAVMDTVVKVAEKKGQSVPESGAAAAQVKKTVFVPQKNILNIVL